MMKLKKHQSTSLRRGDLVGVPPGVEAFAGGERREQTVLSLATNSGLGVAPPFNLNVGPLDREKHDNGGNGNG